MERIQITTDAAGLEIMTAAAAYDGAPLSIWARMVLLKEARAVAHKKLCETPASQKYKWCGRPVTKEVYERESAAAKERADARERDMAPLPADVQAELDKIAE